MTPLHARVLDNVREAIAVGGLTPTIADVAKLTDTPYGTALYAVRALVEAGLLAKEKSGRGLRLADAPDLRGVSTDELAGELARRGVTLASLDRTAPRALGRVVTCAADSCAVAVERGHLMCRQHWFALPPTLRERITRSNARRDRDAFARAVTEARDLIDSGKWRKQ